MPTVAYLDYNATSPVRPAVIEVVADALGRFGNPSSVHRLGRLARRAVETAREKTAALVGAAPEQIVFTSGGTEANALAMTAAAGRRVLVSSLEHDSVLKAHPLTERIPALASGVIDLDWLARRLSNGDPPGLVAVMFANNETGVIQPVAEAARLAHANGALVLCDAIQAAGRISVDLEALGVDFLTLSAHKLGGPQGVGALAASRSVDLDGVLTPFVRGGGQERGRRAGTENVAGIVGFGVAVELAARGLLEIDRIADMRDDLERRALAAAPGAFIVAAASERLPNTSCLALPGVSSEVQVMALDLAGVAVSSGAACSSGKVASSHVLRAMGLSPQDAGSAIRASLGWGSVEEDVNRFVDAWAALAARVAGTENGNHKTASAV